jgi:hypothetical protein
MFCYTCKYDFPRGITHCSECGAMLVYQFPDHRSEPDFETDTGFIVLRRFNNSLDADMARMILTAAGIESVIQKEDFGGGALPHLSFIRGIALLVWAEDLADADTMLKTNIGNDSLEID